MYIITNQGIYLNLFYNLMNYWSLVSGPDCFSQSCSLKEIGLDRKNKVNFFKVFLIILFQSVSFFMQFLACNGYFGLFTKIKKPSRTGFSVHSFCMIFPEKCSFLTTLSIDKVSMSYLFSFSRYQGKCVIEFLFGQLLTS